MSLKVLVGCEMSGIVRDEFIKLGHDAVSCDLLPSLKEGPHIQGDILKVINQPWDLALFFPPCTYLSSSGLHWNKRGRGEELTNDAIEFVKKLLDAPIPHIALENPVGCISSRIRKPDQIINPYQYGEDASKRTCLWLKNLPKLTPTSYIKPKIVYKNGKEYKRWGNQTDSGQNKLGPSEERAMIRSMTYPGVAKALAEQFSCFLEK